MAKYRTLCFLLLMGILNTYSMSTSDVKVTYLRPDKNIHVLGHKNALGFETKSLNIFCWTGRPKVLSNYFETAHLHLSIDSEDFVQYQGPDTAAVLQDIENKKSLFSFNYLWSTNRDRVPINVFNDSCIGMETAHEYTATLHIVPVDSTKLVLLCLAVLLFFVSGRLSENSLFFYICGVSFGVGASFLILVYFASKVFPRKALMYGSLAFGWSLVFYFGKMVWQNLQMLAQSYGEYLMYYCLFTGIISFIICYRYGPPTDRRSKNLIKWSLQGVALVAVWNTTDLKEAAAILCVLFIALYYSPKCSLGRWSPFKRTKKRKLLTLEEYDRQAEIETAKALEALKRFCSSPECNQWKTISRLKNPARFASFIEGDSQHVIDSEILDHEMSELNQLSEDEGDLFERDDSEESDNEAEAAGDQLISEEEEYEVVSRQVPKKLNGSVRREVTYVSNGQRRIIANSRFRAEHTPPVKLRHTPKTRRQFHLSDEE